MISIARKLGFASVPTIGALAVTFGVIGLASGIEWQSTFVQTLLNIGVILSVSLVVVRISAKSFLATGSPNILLLGLAVFEFGLSGTLGGVISGIDIGEGIEMYVLGGLFSSALHLASSVLTYSGSPVHRSRLGLRLWFSYSATAVFVIFLSFLVLNLPILSSIAQIGSLLQRVLIATIMGTLLTSAFFFSRVYSRSHNPILYWYSLALATSSFAFVAFFATQDSGDLATWTGIGGLCLASIYFLKSVLSAPKTSSTGQSLNSIRRQV